MERYSGQFKIEVQSVMPPYAHLMVDAETSSVSLKAQKLFNACFSSIGNEINNFL
jgi:hypothetical protein